MADFHFIRPWFLLAIVPVAIVLYGMFRQRGGKNAWEGVMDAHLFKHLEVGKGGGQRWRPIHVLSVVWVLSVIGLAGPTWQKQGSPFAEEQAGVVVVMKLSGSMEATDVQPSRLERAKFKMRDLIEARAGASHALIVYSGSAHLVMPLTKDGKILNSMAEGLSPAVMPTEGDALVEALKQAEVLLREAGVPGSVMVMADAVDPSQVAELAEVDKALPVEFWAIQPARSPVDKGLEEAARSRGADVQVMTDGREDVEIMSKVARSALLSVEGNDGSEIWQDAGYLCLPVIVLLSGFWIRRGWQ
ncbi:vWA domain-containing protein [Rubritalea tangerina]|uniref:VWA domain-containing protein n=1 Tax=Rubritalea tangerina TaxID=430798 RepID=A0ABW4ZAU7_9BACT